ncbi:hypothetical protein EGW08_002843 [Elysia chlorotica]|uniref:CBM21 domain-containing protein n=1 Tax=Elysia chlorotica TaxID=188477 RepID=A0A3S1HZS4_ELYCH|nr:hypothetical protein EGW08_002843 [Elysia chlorotica]
MYFCPCPCDDPLDPEAEETARVVLPRNLSYVQESYLDRYSVSAGFVHDPKAESSSLRCEPQLAQDTGITCGTKSDTDPLSTGDRAPLVLSSFAASSNVISPNVEDETIALLSILKAKEFRDGFGSGESCRCAVSDSQVSLNGRFSGREFSNSFNGESSHNGSEGAVPFSYSKWTANSIGFLDERGVRSSAPWSSLPPSLHTQNSFSADQSSSSCSQAQHSVTDFTVESPTSAATSSPSTASLLLSPASRVATRLSSFLHTPPNESMDAERNGTSVDGDGLSTALTHKTVSESSPCEMEAPAGLGQEMDRGQDSGGPQTVLDEDNGSAGDSRNLNVHSTSSGDSESVLPLKSEGYVIGSTGHPPRSEAQVIRGTPRQNHPTCHPTGSPSDEDSVTTRLKSSNPPGLIESPDDSDAFSEEGVFVNMMDDLLVSDKNSSSSQGLYSGQADGDSDDDNNKSVSTSVQSDETCMSVDSMFMSPEEGELEEELSEEASVKTQAESSPAETEPPKKMSLQEAISRAASDLSRISIDLYGSEALQQGREEETKDTGVEARSNLITWGRTSPLRTHKALKLTVSDFSSSTSSLASDQPLRVDSGSTELAPDLMAMGPESPIYEENEFNFSRKALRKSSSLKTNKTPPGTPHRKKAVRFADAMGLDLESVRHVLNSNSPPKIPPSAMADLLAGLSEDRKEIGSKYLCPCFNQPGASDNFYQRVLGEKVCLENAIITDLTITGFVRVANISFHKSVRVRYSDNAWTTFHDIAASYVQNSCDGPTDRFSFSLVAPAYFVPGHRLEFAVSYNAGGVEYWDSNGGVNYVFECFAKTVPTESESAWIHFL